MRTWTLPFLMRSSIVILVAMFSWFSPVWAGIFELGASGSFRRSNFDVDAFDEARSLTGSLSYYFSEASALELSYTDGSNLRSISADKPNGHLTTLYYRSLGLDFVYTIGTKESTIRPYVKAGANYIMDKRLVDQYRFSDGTLLHATVTSDEPALVPSAGVGCKIALTSVWSVKMGIEGWSSRPINKQPITYDYAARAGLSWMF